MKTLVEKVTKVTRDNYELKYGYPRYTTNEERERYNQYKEDTEYLMSRINKFGYVGVAL